MLQNTIHDVLRWSNVNRFKRNSLKCKELRIDFRRESNLDTVSLKANGNAFDIVKSAKNIRRHCKAKTISTFKKRVSSFRERTIRYKMFSLICKDRFLCNS